MVPSFCGAMGLVGWLVMLLVWVALIATVVWGITRLFTDRNPPAGPAPPPPAQGEGPSNPTGVEPARHRHTRANTRGGTK